MSRRTLVGAVLGIVVAGMLSAQTGTAPQGLDPGDPARFAQRPLEARWLLYRQDLDANAADKDRKARWVAWLGERGDFELLEMIAVYEGWSVAGPELHRRDAPQWVRVAVWNLASADSHDLGAVQKLLIADAARVLGWFTRYPTAARGQHAEALRAQLQDAAEPGDPGALLPPLDDAGALFAYLDVPRELPTVTADTVKPGERTLHQVVRALRGLRTRAEHAGPHVAKVIRLLEHGDGTVRGEAAQALTGLPGAMLPHAPILALTQAPRPAATRNLATFVLSYCSHPAAFFALHDIAADAMHPGQAAALTRLGELADPITAQLAKTAGLVVPGLEANLAARAKAQDTYRQLALQLTFERAAWAAVTRHASAALAARALFDAAAPLSKDAAQSLRIDPNALPWPAGELSLEMRLAMVKLREELLSAKR